jgi:hypothetical protein
MTNWQSHKSLLDGYVHILVKKAGKIDDICTHPLFPLEFTIPITLGEERGTLIEPAIRCSMPKKAEI